MRTRPPTMRIRSRNPEIPQARPPEAAAMPTPPLQPPAPSATACDGLTGPPLPHDPGRGRGVKRPPQALTQLQAAAPHLPRWTHGTAVAWGTRTRPCKGLSWLPGRPSPAGLPAQDRQPLGPVPPPRMTRMQKASLSGALLRKRAGSQEDKASVRTHAPNPGSALRSPSFPPLLRTPLPVSWGQKC